MHDKDFQFNVENTMLLHINNIIEYSFIFAWIHINGDDSDAGISIRRDAHQNAFVVVVVGFLLKSKAPIKKNRPEKKNEKCKRKTDVRRAIKYVKYVKCVGVCVCGTETTNGNMELVPSLLNVQRYNVTSAKCSMFILYFPSLNRYIGNATSAAWLRMMPSGMENTLNS